MKNSHVNGAAARTVETHKGSLVINNIGIQRGDLEEDDNGVRSPSNSKPGLTATDEEPAGVPPVTNMPGCAVPLVLPSYPMGRGIFLPFGCLLPKCHGYECDRNALIAYHNYSDTSRNDVLCLDHGLEANSDTRYLVLKPLPDYQYGFISLEHEDAIRAFLASP